MTVKQSQFISVTEAITIAKKRLPSHLVSRTSMVKWCRDRRIGKKIAGRWYVATDRLMKLLDGDIQYFADEVQIDATNKKAAKSK